MSASKNNRGRITNSHEDGSHLAKFVEQEMEINTVTEKMQLLKSDNDELRRRLAAMERLLEENSKLRRVKEELHSNLNAAQEDISVLLKEKRILQESVIDLQSQLPGAFGASSRGSAWANKR